VTKATDDLLARAAVFLADDEGEPGFLGRFIQLVDADAGLLAHALERALSARTRAGYAAVELGPGELRVETTSSGAGLTVCSVPGHEGPGSVTIRLVDGGRRPVAGAAVQVTTEAGDQLVVTNPAGWIHVGGAGTSMRIRVGHAPAPADLADAGNARIVRLPRRRARDGLELAAAHGEPGADADDVGQWRIEAGGVEFRCQDRDSGYDITVVVSGVSAEFANSAVGTYGIAFLTWGRGGQPHPWIVPLAPTPAGLAGSLYGIDEDDLDVCSVTLQATNRLVGELGNQSSEVISRSLRHADGLAAWFGLCRYLGPGQTRRMVETALAEREHTR
jgi:hypothetical protein